MAKDNYILEGVRYRCPKCKSFGTTAERRPVEGHGHETYVTCQCKNSWVADSSVSHVSLDQGLLNITE